jgi:hypothetical protein
LREHHAEVVELSDGVCHILNHLVESLECTAMQFERGVRIKRPPKNLPMTKKAGSGD